MPTPQNYLLLALIGIAAASAAKLSPKPQIVSTTWISESAREAELQVNKASSAAPTKTPVLCPAPGRA
jgi:hypothetical protein